MPTSRRCAHRRRRAPSVARAHRAGKQQAARARRPPGAADVDLLEAKVLEQLPEGLAAVEAQVVPPGVEVGCELAPGQRQARVRSPLRPPGGPPALLQPRDPQGAARGLSLPGDPRPLRRGAAGRAPPAACPRGALALLTVLDACDARSAWM